MGSKGGPSSSSMQVQATLPNPEAAAAYSDILKRSTTLSQQEYTPYGGELVQGFSPDQGTAFQNVRDLQGAAQPYIDKATDYANFAATAANPQNFASNVQSYMSPYIQNVVDATRANMQENDAVQQNQVVGNAIAQGALGGDRVGLARANLARQQKLANDQTIGNLYSQGFGQATNQLNAAIGQAGQGAYSLGSLGNEALSTGLSGAQALLGTGGLQQQLGQAQLSTAYQQWLNKQAYPYKNLSWLSGIASGIGPAMGSTSIGTGSSQQSGPSGLNSIFGGLTALAGLIPFRDGGRVPRAGGGGLAGLPYSDDAGSGYVPAPPQIHAAALVPQMRMGDAKPPDQKAQGLQFPKISEETQAKIRKGLGNLFGGSDEAMDIRTGDQISDMMQPSGGNISDFGYFGGLYADGGAVRRGFAFGGSEFDDTTLADTGDYGTFGDLVDRSGEDARPVVLADAGFGKIASDADRTFGRMIGQESGGKQFAEDGRPLTSPKGATGIAQVMPSTGPEAAKLAGLPWDEQRFANDADYNKALGRAYFDKQLADFGGDHEKAAAAYNAGPGRTAQALARADRDGGDWRSYLPTETQDYIAKTVGGGSSATGMDALAYDDAKGGADQSSGGLGAIGRSLRDAFGVAPAAAQEVSPKSQGLLGLNLSPETRQALVAAGLGMMASKSRNLGQAIGEGGLQGVAAYQKVQDMARQRALANAQIQNIGSEIETRKGHLGVEKSKVDIQLQQLQRMLEAARAASAVGQGASPSTVGSSAPAAPSVAASPTSAQRVDSSGGNGAPAALAPAPDTPSVGPFGSLAPVTGGPGAKVTANEPAAHPAAARADAPAAAAQDELADVDPRNNPRVVMQQADIYRRQAQEYRSRGFAAEAAALDQKADAAVQRADALAKSPLLMKDGTYKMLPSVTAATAGNLAAQEKAKADVAAQYRLVDVQPQPGGPVYKVPESSLIGSGHQPIAPGAGTPPGGTPVNGVVAKQPAFIEKRQEKIAEDENNMVQTFQQRQIARERLHEIANLMRTYQTGEWAQQKADLVAKARALGIPVKDSDTANPAAFQQFLKNATANVFDQAKALGGRILVTEIAGLTKANANPEMQPEANRAIVGQALGLLDYEDKHFKDYMAWKRANPYAYDPSQFEQGWVEQNPVSKFTKAAKAEIPVKGEQIPAADQRVIGSVYMTPKGAARWMGNGWKLESAP